MRQKNYLGILVILWVMAILLPGSAIAQSGQPEEKSAPSQSTPPSEVKPAEAKKEEADAKLEKRVNKLEEKIQADEKTFWTNWGVGLIANLASGQKKPVKSASIVNNTVRIDYEEYFQAGIGLEVHKFLYGGDLWRGWGIFASEFAVGPYVSIVPGSNGIISSIGGGIIFGFHGWRKEPKSPPAEPKSPLSKFSMNLGLGGYAAPNVQVLGDGFEENQPPPAGETQIRYKTITQYGWQFVLSFSYNF